MALKLPDTGAEVLPDGRRMVPSAARNAGPILDVLMGLGLKGRLLEIASGSGLHAAEMAGKLALDWQPTDVDPANLSSIRAWAAHSGGAIRDPILLDATSQFNGLVHPVAECAYGRAVFGGFWVKQSNQLRRSHAKIEKPH